MSRNNWMMGLAVALLTCAMAQRDAQGQLVLSLADIVGNGDGTGTGLVNSGYNPRTGAYLVGITSTDNPGASNVYNLVPGNPFIDGVFVPDGGLGPVTVTSTGIAAALPDTDGNSWENAIGNRAACCGGVLNTTSGPVNFFDGSNTGLGFHANKGITFDLDAIRAANPNYTITEFSAMVGAVSGSVDFTVLLDGVQQFQELDILGGENAVPISIPIGSNDRFLTIVGTSGANLSYGGDQGIVGNPQLFLQEVPEPASIALWLCMAVVGLTVAVSWRRRR